MHKKRLISWLLACVMTVSMFPSTVFAATGDEPNMTNEVNVILPGAVVNDETHTSENYEFMVDLQTEDGPLNVVPAGVSVTTGQTTTLTEVLNELEGLGVDFGDHETVGATAAGENLGNNYLNKTLEVHQDNITVWFTGCDGHELTFNGVTGGTAKLLLDGVELTELETGNMASVSQGQKLTIGAYTVDDDHEGEPELYVNGEAVGAEYVLSAHEDITVDVRFAAKPEVVELPVLTLDVTTDCSVVMTDDEGNVIESGAEVEPGTYITVSEFKTEAEYKYDVTDITVRLGDKASEKLSGEVYTFTMPEESTRLVVTFAVKTVASDSRYYIASSVAGGKSDNTGAQDSPLLSMTEAITAAKAAGQTNVEIIFKSDITETDVRQLTDANLGSITSLTINGNNNQLIYNGQKNIGESDGFLNIYAKAHVTLKDLTVTRMDNDYEARLVHAKGWGTTVEMENVTLTGGWLDVNMSNGGSALWVESGAVVTMDDACKVTGNNTVSTEHNYDAALAGAILVGTYDAKDDRGVLNINGAAIYGNETSGSTGAGIYVMPRGELNIYASNAEINVEDEIYLDVGSANTVGSAVGKSDKLNLTRVYLAGDGEDVYKEATLDILGETDNANIGIEGEDSNHYAYRLISRQVDGYEIDASEFDRDVTMDETGWYDIDGKWDIRYMTVWNRAEGAYVTGLYFIYHSGNIQFHDTRTVETIYGKDMTGYQISASENKDIRYLYHDGDEAKTEAPNAVIKPATETGVIDPATGLKGEEYLYIPSIVPVGDGYASGVPGNNQGNDLTAVPDYVVSFDVNEQFQLPPESRDVAVKVQVGIVTKNGVEQMDSSQYKYEIVDGQGVITIYGEALAKLKPGVTIDVKLSAEKIYNLTVQMNGPLYTMTKVTADGTKTVEKHELVMMIAERVENKLVKVVAGYDLDGNGTVDQFRQGVRVVLYAEGTVPGQVESARIIGTAETDANGEASFEIGDETYIPGEGLENSMSFFVVPYYEDTFQVVSSDVLTLDVETIHGHRLRNIQDGAVEYVPSEIDAETRNWSNDGDAAQVILTETRADTRVICYSNLAQVQIFFDRNAPEGCTTANSKDCQWIFQSATGEPLILASTDTESDVRAKAMEAAAVTYGNLPTMKMVGYQFKGWSTDKNATEPNVFSYTAFDYLTSETTLYAVWAPVQVEYHVGHWIEYVSQTVEDSGSETSGEVQGRNPGFSAATTPVLAVLHGEETEYANLAAASQAGAYVTYYLAKEKVYGDTADIVNAEADILSDAEFAQIGTDEGLSWWTLDGFTAKPQVDVKVLADGTAVFMTKYDRNEYTIRYFAEPGILDKQGHVTTHKFGDIVYSMAMAHRDGYDFAAWIVKEADTSRPVTSSDIYVWANDIDVYATWMPLQDTHYQVRVMIENLNTNGVDATEKGFFTAWEIFSYRGQSNTDGSVSLKTVVDLATEMPSHMPDGFTYAGYLEDGDDVADFGRPGDAIRTNGDTTYTVEHLNGDGTTIMYLYFVRNEANVTFSDGVLTENGVIANPAPNEPAWESVTVSGVPYHGQFGDFFPETNPTRAGYDFIGWQDANGKLVNADDYTEEFFGEALKHGNVDFTLYPIWEVRSGDKYNSYYLTYITGTEGKLDLTGIHMDGASDLVANAVQPGGWVVNLPLTYDQAIGYMPTAVRTGYDFTGWFLDEDCTIPLVYASETFRPANSDAPVLTRDGWASVIASIDNVFIKSPDNSVEQLRPVYAGYEAHQHTLVLDANGGTFDADSVIANGWEFVPNTNNQQVRKTVTYGQAIGTMPKITREGYTMTMWRLVDGKAESQIDGDTIWSSTATNGATLTATAMWVNNPYKYKLNLNDVEAGNGSTKAFLSDGSVTDIEVYYDMKYADALNDVSAFRNGYTFLGWSLKQYNCAALDGSQKLELITADTTLTDTSATTLYAVWMPNVYELRVYLNGGVVDSINDNDDNMQNSVFNQNAYAQKYYGNNVGSYADIYAGVGVTIAPLHATMQTDYISVPVVFDTTYGNLPAATREGVDGEKYVFGGYLAGAPAWRADDANGVNVLVLDGKIVRTLDITTLALTNGLFTDYRDDYVTLNAIWSPVFRFDAEHWGEPDVNDSKTNLCLGNNGEPNGDEHTLTLDGSTELTKSVVLSDLTELPEAKKEGFTFLGWFDNDGKQYTLDDLQNSPTEVKLYARFTPTVTFLAEQDGGYVTVDGEKLGKFEIGLSQLLENYRSLPVATTDDGRVFLKWYDPNGQVDASTLANLQGLREPVTLIPDFDYVAVFFLPSGANWKSTGTSETKIIRLENLTRELYESDDMRPMLMNCTFNSWVSMEAPYNNLGLEDLLTRVDGKFTKSYRLMASFTSGGGDAGDGQNIQIAVTDYTQGKMRIDKMLNGTVAAKTGEAVKFIVSCDEVCSVALRRGGELTELKAVAVDGGYEFTIEAATEGDEIVVALLGDVNLNGEANGEDLALFAQAIRGKYQFETDSAMQYMVGDVNHNGEANGEDLALFAQHIRGNYTCTWNEG